MGTQAPNPSTVKRGRWLWLSAGVLLALTIGWLHHRGGVRAEIVRADPERVLSDVRLAPTALAIGRKIFAAHCAACHGDGGQGDSQSGVPDLRDGDYIYGTGLVAEIEEIVLHGIRSGDSRGWGLASMPAYARPKPYDRDPIPPLSPGDIADVTAFVRGLGGQAGDLAAIRRGEAIYQGRGGCWDCHDRQGRGDAGIGAPNLADAIWLHGDGSASSVSRSIAHGLAGISPAFAKRISPFEARAVSLYVASLAAPTKTEVQP